MLEQAFEVGIERIVTISVSADNLDTVRSLADTHPQVWCTQGIHPHEADSWDASLSMRVRDGCTHERVIAVGEIGLDYYYDHADRQAQISAFDEQLALAAELALPVVIHTRDADEDTRAILITVTRWDAKASFTASQVHWRLPSSASKRVSCSASMASLLSATRIT